MALLIGFVLVALLGVGHHFALLGLRKVAGDPVEHPHWAIVSAFIGLLIVHTGEILLFAVAYALLLNFGWIGNLAGEFGDSWSGLIYFSGINFTTLGYTQSETEGPIRIVNMMQSLGGFMILTWSATFIYSLWSKAVARAGVTGCGLGPLPKGLIR